MALQYRKVVRDAILGLLRTNFNSVMNSLADVYKIVPQAFDFTHESTNFAVTHIDQSNIETCQIQWGSGVQVGGCLYTTDAIDTGIPRGLPFAGSVLANVDLFVRDRTDGAEGFNTEDYFDAYEDGVLSVMNDPANQWPAGVILSRQSRMQREHLIPLGDGFATCIPIQMAFEVKRTSL